MKLSLKERLLCLFGFHVGKWESLYTSSWRDCERCGHRSKVERSWM